MTGKSTHPVAKLTVFVSSLYVKFISVKPDG